MPKVYVVGGHSGVERMFMGEGWEIAGSLNKADLVCFTGGADVRKTFLEIDWQMQLLGQ